MPDSVYLRYLGNLRKLADWGIAKEGIRHTRRNLAAGTYQFFIPTSDVTAAPTFPFEASITIRRTYYGSSPSTRDAFQGKCTGITMVTSGGRVGYQYTFSNAWYDLENTLYQQAVQAPTYTANGVTFLGYTYPYISGLVLFAELDQGYIVRSVTTGGQIQNVLEFLIDLYAAQGLPAPFQIGIIDPDLPMPPYECQEMSCAEVIRKCLELHPDCVFDFDYETTPPTVHVRRRANLTPVSLAYDSKAGDTVSSFNLIPRYDLVPRAVLIYYLVTSTTQGVTRVDKLLDKYGPHGQDKATDPDAGLRVIVQTIDMAGPRYASVENSIVCEAVDCNNPNSTMRFNWWVKAHGGGRIDFLNSKVRNLVIADATIKSDLLSNISLATYPYRVTEGSVLPWMNSQTVRATISAAATWEIWSDATSNGYAMEKQEGILSTQVLLSSLPSGTYSTITENAPGEVIPGYSGWGTNARPIFTNGIAKKLYDSLSTLQYDGEHVRVADVCPGTLTLLNTVNFTNGRSEWASMNATVQEIIEDDGRGETFVRVGVSRQFTAGNLAAIWRFNKLRRYLNGSSGRDSAIATNTGQLIVL